MLSTARAAYAAPGAPTRTLRGTEYEAVARITQRLKDAAARADADFPALAAALVDNTRLWMAFAADVADEGNALPRPLRGQIFWLFDFTDRHTRKVLAGEAKPDILVDINLAILRGLRGETGADGLPRDGVA